MSHEALNPQQFRTVYHGTTVAGADNVLREGQHAGLWYASTRKAAGDFADRWDEDPHPGGVVMEGRVHESATASRGWVGSTPIGQVTTPGAFQPTRLHWPDGTKTNLT